MFRGVHMQFHVRTAAFARREPVYYYLQSQMKQRIILIQCVLLT
jgi:hypothetical protein